MPVFCIRTGCNRTWKQDPILLVACPKCGAAIGTRCMRPSGHRGKFVAYHAARDLEALKAGLYGVCPLGRCCSSYEEYLERQRTRQAAKKGPAATTAASSDEQRTTCTSHDAQQLSFL